jgi:hypothetical protein
MEKDSLVGESDFESQKGDLSCQAQGLDVRALPNFSHRLENLESIVLSTNRQEIIYIGDNPPLKRGSRQAVLS